MNTTKKDEALKLALEALEYWQARDEFSKQTSNAITAIRESLAEHPAQHRHISYVCPQCYWSLEEQPAQQQEPVAWATRMGEYAHIHWGAKRPEYPMVYEVPLYTSPPASKPLTHEQLEVIVGEKMKSRVPSQAFRQGFRAAEAAHGIGKGDA